MTAAAHHDRSLTVIRREAYVQLGLGAFELAASGLVAWWLLLGRITPIVWIGVLGTLALAAVFLQQGLRANREHSWLRNPSRSTTATRLAALEDAEQDDREARRARLLILMLSGIVASVSAPGLNILLRIASNRHAEGLDLLAWVLLSFRSASPCGPSRHEGFGSRLTGLRRHAPTVSRDPGGWTCRTLHGQDGVLH